MRGQANHLQQRSRDRCAFSLAGESKKKKLQSESLSVRLVGVLLETVHGVTRPGEKSALPGLLRARRSTCVDGVRGVSRFSPTSPDRSGKPLEGGAGGLFW